MNPEDYFGACSFDKDGVWAVGECVGNFLNPSLPNPIGVLAPIQGERLQSKLDAVNVFDFSVLSTFDIGELVSRIVNILIVLFALIVELLASCLTYALVFAFKFAFTYLFWVSLGFQTILAYVQQDNIEGGDKIKLTFWVMGIATIATLTVGGGWVAWS